MRIFFNALAKTLGILLGFSIIIIILGILLNLLNDPNFNRVSNFEFIEGDEISENKIIYLDINGPIFSRSNNNISLINSDVIYANLVEQKLLNMSEEKNIKALLISLNSPGGTVSGSNRLYEVLMEFKKKFNIPIYIHVQELLASGAMWAALPADKIYASYGAIIGNIGVKGPSWFVYNNPKSIKTDLFGSDIDTEDGIDFYQPYAGRSKDIFNPFRQPTNEEINNIQNMLDSIYEQFVIKISKHRKIEGDYIKNNIGALLYDSKTAKSHNLVDGVYSFDMALKQLINNLDLSNDYKLLKIKGSTNNLIRKFSSILFENNSSSNKKVENDICNLKNQQLLLMTKFTFNSCKNWLLNFWTLFLEQ